MVTKFQVFDFLDNLRESGMINMLESPNTVQAAFGIKYSAAINVVAEWMRTFGIERHLQVDEVIDNSYLEDEDEDVDYYDEEEEVDYDDVVDWDAYDDVEDDD